MNRLSLVALFVACAAGAAEHKALHISFIFEALLIAGAVVAYFNSLAS